MRLSPKSYSSFWLCGWNITRQYLQIFYYRAVELIEEAGFKVGKSDGGLVTEAKPPVKWDKGNAAIYILKTAYGVHWADNIRVIFAGDDLTDEDAMKALKVPFTTYLILCQNNCSIWIFKNFDEFIPIIYLGDGLFIPCHEFRNGSYSSRSPLTRYQRSVDYVEVGWKIHDAKSP